MFTKMKDHIIFNKIIAVFIFLSLTFANIPLSFDLIENDDVNIDREDPIGNVDGVPGQDASLSQVNDCVDAAHVYLGCEAWLNHKPSNRGYHGTIVVIDDALGVNQWDRLELHLAYPNLPSVDIIRYVTVNSNGNIREYGGSGADGAFASSSITNSRLGFNGNNNHGLYTTSVIAQIARGASVIFMSIDLDGDGTGFKNINTDTKIWDWILDNRAEYNIKAISMSFGYRDIVFTSPDVISKLNNLHTNGVFMITSMGNNGQNLGSLFPIAHQYVYSIGSIDHETRSVYHYPCPGQPWWYGGCWITSSVKDQFSGSSQQASLLTEECYDPKKLPFCSSFGEGHRTSHRKMDFSMPGHGVPILKVAESNFGWSYESKFIYGVGTSFSAPYLTAAAIIANYGFTKGYLAAGGSATNPSPSQIYNILQNVANNPDPYAVNYWSPRYGYGYIDFYDVYSFSYSLGYNSAPPGGGWM
jgi:hypothetical protein